MLDPESIGREALGTEPVDRYATAAVAEADALVESDPTLERWVAPLVRAIRRRRLQLPSLSVTTHRVLRLIDAAEVGIDELAEAVNADPVLATRIMGVANSTYFRGAAEVPSVREALMRMGLREARTIIVVVALRSTLLRSPGVGQSAQSLWRHSLLAASATQQIAEALPPWERTGFLAGLIHDLGQLAVLAFVAELPAWQEDGTEPSDATVEAMVAATHAPIGAMILASWGFPDSLCEAVLAHHDPERVDVPARSLARSIELGDAIADQIALGWPEDLEELPEELCRAAAPLGLELERLTDIADDAEANFEALSKLG